MGIGPDFFILIGSDPNKSEEIEPMIETFIQADGSDSLLTSEVHLQKSPKIKTTSVYGSGETRFMGLSMQILEELISRFTRVGTGI